MSSSNKQASTISEDQADATPITMNMNCAPPQHKPYNQSADQHMNEALKKKNSSSGNSTSVLNC